MSVPGTIVALVIVVIIILFSAPLVSKLEAAIKGFSPLVDAGQDNKNSGSNRLSGKLSIKIIKFEDSSDLKPTSKDFCLVRGLIKNDGLKTWTKEDKIQAKLFCKSDKNQLKDVTSIDTYPALDNYISDLQPGQQREFIFPRSPDTCAKSADTYSVILYSNSPNPSTEITKAQFNCN